MRKRTRNKVLIIGFTMFLIAGWILISTKLEYTDIVGYTIDLLAVLIAFLGALLVVIQLHGSEKIQTAEFIMNLNQGFVENELYAKVYSQLEGFDLRGEKVTLTRSEISNYLTFFETVYLLFLEGAINIDVLNDLFAYRFFLAVHNEYIQEAKLVSSPNNFRNIYYLEKLWMDYRKENGQTIYKEDNCLENALKASGSKISYDYIISTKDKAKKKKEKK